MLSSSPYAMLKLSKTSSPQKLFDYACVTLYILDVLSCPADRSTWVAGVYLDDLKENIQSDL